VPGARFKKKNGKSRRTKVIAKNLSLLQKKIFQNMKKIDRLKPAASLIESYLGKASPNSDIPEPPGIIDSMLQGSYILANRMIQLQLQLTMPDVLITPDVSDFHMLEFHRARDLISAGELAARQQIASIAT